jgi:hypothetical protein
VSDSYVIVSPHPVDLENGAVGVPGMRVDLEEAIAAPLRADGLIVHASEPTPEPYVDPIEPAETETQQETVESDPESAPEEQRDPEPEPAAKPPRKRATRAHHPDPAPAEKQEKHS